MDFPAIFFTLLADSGEDESAISTDRGSRELVTDPCEHGLLLAAAGVVENNNGRIARAFLGGRKCDTDRAARFGHDRTAACIGLSEITGIASTD